MSKKQYIVLLLGLLSWCACRVGQVGQGWDGNKKNWVIFKYSSLTENAKARVVRTSEQILLCVQTNVENYTIEYEVFDKKDDRKKISVESGVRTVENAAAQSIQQIPLSIQPSDRYEIHVFCYYMDKYGTYFYEDIIQLDLIHTNSQTLTITDTADIPILDHYTTPQQRFKVQTGLYDEQPLYIKYFKDNGGLAPPPYSNRNTVFYDYNNYDALIVSSTGKLLSFEQEGRYFLQIDTTTEEGIFFNCYYEDYPKMNRLGDLVEATRYITKNEEYNGMMDATDKKAAFDAFWLGRTSDKDRARKLLQTYYQRIAEANQYFSIDAEGWRTDRGIVYTILGAPTKLKKRNNQEIWIYPPAFGRYEVEFIFEQVGEQYILDRSPDFKTYWGAKVQQWRNGRI